MAYEFENIKCTVEDHVASIVIDAQPMNLLSTPMLRDLESLMSEMESDKDIWVAIVTGAGSKAFCAGADVGELTDPTIDQLEASDVWARNVLTRFSNLPFPVIAAINGYALGGGFELCLACDVRIASSSAKVGMVETKIGLIAGWGGSQRFVRLVGPGVAKKLMFTSEKITAEVALEYGLVQEVVEPEELMDSAYALAEKMKACSPVANALTKRAINAYLNQGIMDGLDLERRLDREAYLSADSKEGMKAFEERRKPEWSNS